MVKRMTTNSWRLDLFFILAPTGLVMVMRAPSGRDTPGVPQKALSHHLILWLDYLDTRGKKAQYGTVVTSQ